MEIGAAGILTGIVTSGVIGALIGQRRQVALPPRHNAEACRDFDLSAAYVRFRNATGLDQAMARRVEHEFRRYFTLRAMAPEASLGMKSALVDAFWHEVILCTKLYRDYCTAGAGRFVDHDPTAGDDDAYARTWGAYAHVFDQDPDSDIWPEPDPNALGRLRLGFRQHSHRNDRWSVMTVVTLSAADSGSHDNGADGDAGGDGCGGK